MTGLLILPPSDYSSLPPCRLPLCARCLRQGGKDICMILVIPSLSRMRHGTTMGQTHNKAFYESGSTFLL